MLYKNLTSSAQVQTGNTTIQGFIVNSHSSGTLRLNDGESGTTSAGVKANQTLTASGVFSDGETVTIGDKTYTFVDALTSPSVANEVLIGASAAASLDNLKSAINASAGEGTTYGTGTEANPNVEATDNADTTQKVEAYRVGTYGNDIASTETCDNASWGAAKLANGAEASLLAMNTFTFPTGSGVYMLGEGINMPNGAYATIGGTADITIIYE